MNEEGVLGEQFHALCYNILKSVVSFVTSGRISGKIQSFRTKNTTIFKVSSVKFVFVYKIKFSKDIIGRGLFIG